MKLACKRGKVVVMAPRVAGALAAPNGAGNGEAVAVGVQDGEANDAAFHFQDVEHDGVADVFNDDYDSDGGEGGGGFMLAGDSSAADGAAAVGHGFQGLLVEKAERVEKIDIAYAKVAKKVRVLASRVTLRGLLRQLCVADDPRWAVLWQVDVKKLKENIWTYVSRDKPSDAPAPALDGGDEASVAPESASADAPVDGVSFQATVAALAPQAPSSITVPFYFICMLHLANEKGLALHPSEDLSDFRVSTVTGSEDADHDDA